MVKVLENRIIDLDILPGTKEEQLMAQAQTQVDAAGNEIKTLAANQLTPEQKQQLEGAIDKLPEEQKTQAQNLLGGASNIVVGTAGTAGGAVKGVLDTVGDTVGTLGGGLGNTLYDAGSGLVSLPGQAVKGYKGEPSTDTATGAPESTTRKTDLETPKKKNIESETKKTGSGVETSAKKADSDLKTSTKKAESSLPK